MDFIITNWYLLVAAIAFICVAAIAIYKFYKLPTKTQMDCVRKWLLYAVTMAEAEFGNGTGALKLRSVYDLFLVRFPQISKVVSFELFSLMVDNALEEMEDMLANNEAIRDYVECTTECE